MPGKPITTRERILKVAGVHFADHGFDGARMDRIAADAGVNKASIYYNIGNKEALYATVLNTVFEEEFEPFNDVVHSDMGSAEKLASYVRHIADGLSRHPIIPKILMREQLSQGKYLPDLFVSNIVRLLDGLGRIVKQGVENGEFDPVDTVTLHFMILGTMVFQMTSSPIRQQKKGFPDKYQPHPGILPDAVVKEVTRNVLKAVKKDT